MQLKIEYFSDFKLLKNKALVYNEACAENAMPWKHNLFHANTFSLSLVGTL
jgi:hypothetical protein